MINFLFLAIITYLAGVFFRVHSIYNLAYFFLLLDLLLKFYHYNIRKNLFIRHSIKDQNLFLNEKTCCEIEIVNRGKLPIVYLEVEERLPLELTPLIKNRLFSLKAGEKKVWRIDLQGRKRGYYQIGPLEWQSTDIIGYIPSKGGIEKIELVVFPQILSLEELGLPSRIAFGNLNWPLPIFKDPYQMQGIREYSSGDSINRIHWKASAKTGKLQVREHPSTVSLEVGLFLNLSEANYGVKRLQHRTELAITATASIAYYLNQIGQSFALETNGVSPFASPKNGISHSPGSSETHLQEVLESLASIKLTEEDNFQELLESRIRLAWGSAIIIVTNEDSKKLIKIADNLIRRGYLVKIIILNETVRHKQYLGKSLTAPLSIYQLNREEDFYGLSQL
ncbi:MAG: DUF58 domain-containing protein [bacterium]